jgi:parvulin-like peptidyl-prolyl isomerase
MLVSQVQQVEIINRVGLTDVEAREYYDSHLEEFTTPATATLREILIGVPEGTTGVNAASDEQARTVAETTVARLRAGEDFATLAAEVSESPSKANGGLIGPLRVDEYSDVIRQFIETLDVGGVADPLRTPQGYQIVMLEERTSAVADPYENVRDDIANSVFNDRRTAEYAEYLETLRDEATIEWKNDDLRQAYDDYRAANPTARPTGQ